MDGVKGQQVRESEWEVDGGFVQPGDQKMTKTGGWDWSM